MPRLLSYSLPWVIKQFKHEVSIAKIKCIYGSADWEKAECRQDPSVEVQSKVQDKHESNVVLFRNKVRGDFPEQEEW